MRNKSQLLLKSKVYSNCRVTVASHAICLRVTCKFRRRLEDEMKMKSDDLIFLNSVKK